MRNFIALLLMITPAASFAADFKIWELDELKFTYRSFFEGGRDPLITDNGLPNRALGKELNLTMNTSLFKYGYFNNTIHSMTDEIKGTGGSGQFRMVGWEFGLGVDFSKISKHTPFSVGYYHYSQHALDHTYPWAFPVKDAIEVNIYLFRK